MSESEEWKFGLGNPRGANEPLSESDAHDEANMMHAHLESEGKFEGYTPEEYELAMHVVERIKREAEEESDEDKKYWVGVRRLETAILPIKLFGDLAFALTGYFGTPKEFIKAMKEDYQESKRFNTDPEKILQDLKKAAEKVARR